MIVGYARVWFPISLLTHIALIGVLQCLPAPIPVGDSPTSYIRVDMVEANQSKEAVAPEPPARPQPVTPNSPLLPRQANQVTQPSSRNNGPVQQTGPTHIAANLHPKEPSLTNGGAAGSPRDPLERPGGGTGYENGIRNLPGVPVDTDQRTPGGWADRPGAGGNPGFGLHGAGKLSPLPEGGGSGTNARGPVGNAGALHPGVPSSGYAGRGGGYGGGNGGVFSPTGGGGRGITIGDGVGTMPGSGPAVIHGGNGTWADRPGGGGFGGGTSGFGGGLASIGPGHGPGGKGHGGGGTSLVGAVGNGTGLNPGAGIGRGPGRQGFGGGGGGLDGHGTPSAGGDILGSDVRRVAIASAGGPKGHGGAWADRPGGGGGFGGNGSDLRPAGPSYGASALNGPNPRYPGLALKEGQHGTVLLAVSLNTVGLATKVDIKTHSNSDALDNEAKRTIRNWKFRPAMRNGEAVNSIVMISVRFELGKEPEVKQL